VEEVLPEPAKFCNNSVQSYINLLIYTFSD
jgi:hypothetical protein